MKIIPKYNEDIVRCMKCGNCQETCPVYIVTGRESKVARGRVQLLKAVINDEIEITPGVQESVLSCLQCDACNVTCPPGVPVNDLLLAAKAAMLEKGIELPENQKRITDGIGSDSNPFDQPKQERGAWLPPDLREPRPSKNLLHAGCAISYASNRIGKAVIRILQKLDFDFTMMGNREECCGDPLVRLGDVEQAKKQIERNKANWKELGVETVITPCAGCFKALKEHYSDAVKPLHVVQLFAQLIDEGKMKFSKPLKKRVVYFDGCDIGRHGEVYEEPRKVLASIPEIDLIDYPKNRENSQCCGGPILGSYPDLARKIAAQRVQEAINLNADMIAVACPTCLLNLKEGARAAGLKMDIQDVTALAMRAFR